MNSAISTSEITISDNAGNIKICSVDAYVDKEEPSCGDSKIEHNNQWVKWTEEIGWAKDKRKVNIECSDNNGSGCKENPFIMTFNSKENDISTSEIIISDKVGNSKECVVDVYIEKDNEEDEFEDNIEFKYYKNGNITEYNPDTIEISMFQTYANIEYNIYNEVNELQPKGTSTIVPNKMTISNIGDYKDGIYVLEIKFINSNGKITTKTSKYTIDKTAPTCGLEEVKIDGNWIQNSNSIDWTNKDREIRISCNDGIGTGCTSVTKKFTANNNTILANGTIVIKDKAGNSANCSVKVNIDKIAPTCGTVETNNNEIWTSDINWTNKDREIRISCQDQESGCIKTCENSTNPDCTKQNKIFKTEQNTTLENGQIAIKDKAGNTTTCSVPVNIDKESPICGEATVSHQGIYTKWTENIGWTKGERNVALSCLTNNGSPCYNDTYYGQYKDANTAITTKKITIADQAGNTTTCPVDVYLDNKLPTCGTAEVKHNNQWVTWTESIGYEKNTRNVRIYCEEKDGSGCSNTLFSKKFNQTPEVREKETIEISDKVGNTVNCPVDVYIRKRNYKTLDELIKNDGTIAVGDHVTTSGYYEANDGGGASYYITAGTTDTNNGDIIQLNNGLKAHLIIENDKINVLQYGVKQGLDKTNTTKNTEQLQKAIEKAKEIGAIVYFPKGYYLIGNIDIGNYPTITFEGENPITNYTYTNKNDTNHSIIIFNGKQGKANPMIKQVGGILIMNNLAIYGYWVDSNGNKYGSTSSYFSLGGGGGEEDYRGKTFAQSSEFSGWKSTFGGAHINGDTNFDTPIMYNTTPEIQKIAFSHVSLIMNNCYFYGNDIAMSQVSDTRISSTNFSNNQYDIAIGAGSGGITIFDSIFENTEKNSIYIGASEHAYNIDTLQNEKNFASKINYPDGPHDITIQDNTFKNQTATPIYIKTTPIIKTASNNKKRLGPTGILVIGNTFTSTINYTLPSLSTTEIDSQKTRIYSSGCEGCIIAKNKEETKTDASLYLRYGTKIIFANNFENSDYYYLSCKSDGETTYTTTMSNFLRDDLKQAKVWKYEKTSCSDYNR